MVDFESMRAIPLRLWVIAILSGVVQALSFPIAGSAPLWRSALCWVALAPLLMALTGKDANGRPLRAIQGAALGYCSGFVWYLGNCYWIYPTMHSYGGIARPVSAGILVLFCLYLGLYHALFGTLIAVLRRGRLGVQGALLVSPFAWVAVELARARITSFPWDQLGVAQVDNPLLTRLAPYTGVYGLSFVIAAVNALWLTRISLKDRRYTRTGLTVAGVAIVLLYVVFLRHTQRPAGEGASATAVLVQENIGVGAAAASAGPELTIGQELSTFSSLSLFPLNGEVCYGMPEVSSTKCVSQLSPQQGNSPDQTHYLAQTDAIVWPEAPNRFVDTYREFRAAMSRLAREANAPVIVAGMGVDADSQTEQGYHLYNSANFIRPDGSFAQRYDKMHLVPFGEYTRLRNYSFSPGICCRRLGYSSPASSGQYSPLAGIPMARSFATNRSSATRFASMQTWARM